MRAAALACAALGLLLLAANTVGLRSSHRHPGAGAGAAEIVDDVRFDAAEARRRLEAAGQIEDPAARLRAVNDAVAGGIAHYWTQGSDFDRSLRVPFTKNWVLYLAAWLDPLWTAVFGSPEHAVGHYEYRNVNDALERGIGLCSQASMATVGYLLAQGIDARLVSLGGHTVASARLGGREFVLDPDFGVVLDFGVEHAERHPEDVERAYRDAGYPADRARGLAALYGPEGNRVIWGGEAGRRPGRVLLERGAQALKWTGPLALLLPALWLRRRAAAR